MKKNWTLIPVKKTTRKMMKGKRVTVRETYDEIINRLIEFSVK